MLFNSTLFILFLVTFLAIYTFVARTRDAKLVTITVGSCVFYAGWDYRFVPLLLGTAALDFWLAKGMERHRENRPARKRLLVLSIVLNLGVLFYFKYTNFFLDSAYGLMDLLGMERPTTFFDIALPVGISFYTFQSMSYTIDVYRGTMNARERPLEFLAGVSFFPHLVAGPIIRASVLVPQFEAFKALPWKAYRRGVMLICVGLFNKAIADMLGIVVDELYGATGPATALAAWTGCIAFAGQLYGDFCGYTDIAIGVALLLGFEIPPNFNLPYLATTPVEVWTRWHISLSTWLRDYVYLPQMKADFLAKRKPRPYRALFITIVLAGLWHGATWTFVAWGIVEGTILNLNHWLFQKFPKLKKVIVKGWPKILAIAITFYCWLLGGIMFRAPNFTRCLEVAKGMHFGSGAGTLSYASAVTLFLVCCGLVAGHFVSWLAQRHEPFQTSKYFWPTLLFFTTFALCFGGVSSSFVYFAF
jgi:D-alanyl-lipoteichoic acid acyltransferase DltB (MBOAT superfamily)